MVAYVVEQLEDVTLDFAGPDGRLAHFDLMSPYVWTERGAYRLLVRVLRSPLGPTDPTGVIWSGHSHDGLYFRMRDTPAITPGPNPNDVGGCEDPTVTRAQNGDYLVFYTGVDATRSQGALLVAKGPAINKLDKQ